LLSRFRTSCWIRLQGDPRRVGVELEQALRLQRVVGEIDLLLGRGPVAGEAGEVRDDLLHPLDLPQQQRQGDLGGPVVGHHLDVGLDAEERLPQLVKDLRGELGGLGAWLHGRSMADGREGGNETGCPFWGDAVSWKGPLAG
jgi:hypothetical protein